MELCIVVANGHTGKSLLVDIHIVALSCSHKKGAKIVAIRMTKESQRDREVQTLRPLSSLHSHGVESGRECWSVSERKEWTQGTP